MREWLRTLVETRTGNPRAVFEAAKARGRCPRSTVEHQQLLIIAADHAARGAIGAGDDPMAMASRHDLIDRLLVALARPGVHGVLATADILEDLLLLGALDGKLVIGSMNRGGLAGSVFEMDDRFTGYDVKTLSHWQFDGGKMLLRIDPDDPGTLTTLESCASAVTELADHRLMALVEPFWLSTVDGRRHIDLSPPAMMRAIAVASGLGATAAYTWLKVPVVDDMERVMEAATLPVLLLGGDTREDQDELFERWRKALTLPTVRGLVAGRNLLYPPDSDVAAAVDTAVSLL